jgi:hypothetical protein
MVTVDKLDASDNMEGVFISDERSAKSRTPLLPNGQAHRGPAIAERDAGPAGWLHSCETPRRPVLLPDEFSAARLYLDIKESLAKKGAPGKEHEDMSSTELMEDIRKTRSEGKPTFLQETELHKRLSIPFACLIFGLIGAPLGIRRHRAGKSAGVAIALLVFLVYYIIMGSASNLAETGTFSPLLAYWIPNLVMALLSIVFLFKKGREIDFSILSVLGETYYRWRAKRKRTF